MIFQAIQVSIICGTYYGIVRVLNKRIVELPFRKTHPIFRNFLSRRGCTMENYLSATSILTHRGTYTGVAPHLFQ